MPSSAPISPDAALSLALAVVGSSTAPLLLLDGDLTVLAASGSFCQAFHIPPIEAVGQPVLNLGDGEWNVPQLGSLLRAAASDHAEVPAYEMDLKAKGQRPRRLVLSARKLNYGVDQAVRLMLTVIDVTDARLAEKIKDDLVQEKAILLQELQHRVANSLQIIASIILQTARKAQQDETRAYLEDAHNRVMSIATLQQQLAASRVGDVELRGYFTQLCDSIGASMIRDHNQLTLSVEADASTTSADASVSLGLIVTELVINALKHAFPGGRQGMILVSYYSAGPNWSLSVRDDGVGMPKAPDSAKPGLGTNIIQALASQLEAEIKVSDAEPGTLVSIRHKAVQSVTEPKAEASPV
ncbi:sensor histidine kinase [Phenylobacterium aquaticum]|uniref:sensor histidine kinase n=1 Tax=Phenylobacterium aquaticum TaxID=1763816 RepID=UPI0026E9F769|nr:histidine kinase dimerization/phosphoacceptor domain -containing protein [Phenylobacterium aquaticum]